jgi:hypothetical protein
MFDFYEVLLHIKEKVRLDLLENSNEKVSKI